MAESNIGRTFDPRGLKKFDKKGTIKYTDSEFR